MNLNERLKRLLCSGEIDIEAFYCDVERSGSSLELLEKRDLHQYKSSRLILRSPFVFPTPTGKLMDYSNFRDRAWKWVLKECQLEYQKPYQMRHSFATICIKSGFSVVDIAKIMGNSPQVVLANYAGATRDLVAPEV